MIEAGTSNAGALGAAGYALIPLCSPTAAHGHKGRPCTANRGKVPLLAGYPDAVPGAYRPAPGENYGIALKNGDLVVDVDPRRFPKDDDPLARFVADVGLSFDPFIVETGGGGRHIYLTKPADLDIVGVLPGYPGLEFKSYGQQVVGPGSVHKSGKPYKVVCGLPSSVAAAPEKLLTLLSRGARPPEAVEEGAFTDDHGARAQFLDYLRPDDHLSVEGNRGDETAFKVACRARDLGLPPAVALRMMLEAWNPRCSPPWEDDDLQATVENPYRYARGAVGGAAAAADFQPVAPVAAEKKLEWEFDKQGRVKPQSFKNLLNYMRIPDGGLYKAFAKNEFTGRVEFARPVPWHRGKLPASKCVTEHDLHMLKGYLVERHKFETPVRAIEESVTCAAYDSVFHPVREYLEGLTWDGIARLDTWMRTYLGAVDGGSPEYLAAVSRKILVAAVMRVFKPSIKFDHVPVLEGAQDLGKSTVVAILGGEWASDAPIDPHSRDTVDAMQGRWIIEMAEMESTRKSDADALKAFITRPTDRVRLAYGRSTGEFARQSIFIATKNPGTDGTYLKDETGARRWWPVRLEPKTDPETGHAQIDFNGLRKMRNQLFAEAVIAAKQVRHAQELSMDTPLLKEQAATAAQQRFAAHEWQERIGDWIAQQDSRSETRPPYLTARSVFVDAMGGQESHFTRKDALAVSQCLKALGWNQKLLWRNDQALRAYVRPAPVEAADLAAAL